MQDQQQILLDGEVIHQKIMPKLQGAWVLLLTNSPIALSFLVVMIFWASHNFFVAHHTPMAIFEVIIGLLDIIYLIIRKNRFRKQLSQTCYIFTNLRCIIDSKFPHKDIRTNNLSKANQWEFYQNPLEKILNIHSLYLGQAVVKDNRRFFLGVNAAGRVPFLSQADKETLSVFLKNLQNSVTVSSENKSQAIKNKQFIPESFVIKRSSHYFFALLFNYIFNNCDIYLSWSDIAIFYFVRTKGLFLFWSRYIRHIYINSIDVDAIFALRNYF